MDIKIDCSCGIRYEFEVEPVNGQMPVSVQCPQCSVDGTSAANEFIRLAGQVEAEPAPQKTPTVALAHPPSGRPATPTLHAPPQRPQKRKREFGEPNITLGTVGAVGAAFVGMMIWYFLIKLTNTEYGIVAWGVGGLTGVGCRLLGGGYSQKLGIIAAVCALVAIVGGEFLATNAAYNQFVGEFLEQAYDGRMAYAQRAVKHETDQDVRTFLAREQSEEGAPVTPESIPQEDITEFKKNELPQLKEFINGRPSRSEYQSTLQAGFNSVAMKGSVLKNSVSLWTLLWLFLGVGSAYRLGTGETE